MPEKNPAKNNSRLHTIAIFFTTILNSNSHHDQIITPIYSKSGYKKGIQIKCDFYNLSDGRKILLKTKIDRYGNQRKCALDITERIKRKRKKQLTTSSPESFEPSKVNLSQKYCSENAHELAAIIYPKE